VVKPAPGAPGGGLWAIDIREPVRHENFLPLARGTIRFGGKTVPEPGMIDRLDRKILSILQEDATIPVAEIGKRVGLSTTPCWRRIQKLEEDGVIQRRVAVLDPKKINAKVTVFVAITTSQHSEEWLRRFAEVIRDFPEVVEFYRMSGQVDYLLRVVVPDIEAYDAFYKRLIARIDIADVSSSFAMEQIKYTTALPLQFIPIEKERSAG
jgi:Lrp/AsnC family transcriptional regulator